MYISGINDEYWGNTYIPTYCLLFWPLTWLIYWQYWFISPLFKFHSFQGLKWQNLWQWDRFLITAFTHVSPFIPAGAHWHVINWNSWLLFNLPFPLTQHRDTAVFELHPVGCLWQLVHPGQISAVIWLCVSVFVFTCICVSMYKCISMYVYIHTYIRMHLCLYIDIYIYLYMYIYMARTRAC